MSQRRRSDSDRPAAEPATSGRVPPSPPELAERQLELLAEAGQTLASDLDVASVLATSLDLVLAEVASAALIHLLTGDGLVLAGARHRDPHVQAVMAKAFALIERPAEEPFGMGYVVTHGATQIVASLTDADMAALLPHDPEAAAVLLASGVSAGMSIPLTARGRTIGALSLGWSDEDMHRNPDRNPHARAHLTLIEQLAARIALAIDNSQLYTEAQQARAQAERAGRQLALLSEVSQALSSTLDAQESVGRLARLVVPRLADWCIVTLVDEEDGLADVGRWHRDPERRADLDTYADLRVRSSRASAPVRRVIETGQPVIVPVVDRTVIEQALHDGPARAALTRLNAGSSVELPLRGRGRTLGALTLVNSPERGQATAQDVALATEVARRAGLALDNAQLFARQRAVAEMLQHSLLTEPPAADHLQIAVRYRPAASNVQVGGDWYDAFLQPDGATMLVIGDVMGHDIGAAAAMGQIRSLVRGIAFDRQDSPAGVLTRVDQAIAGLAVNTLATALLARIEPPGQHRPPHDRVVLWSSAGHPQPMLLTADGAVSDLHAQPGILLGVLPDAERFDTRARLPVGSTLLLFTDGLFERRRFTVDEGLARVRAKLHQLTDLALEPLCDALLDGLLDAQPEDDVALVAIRVLPPGPQQTAVAAPTETAFAALGHALLRIDADTHAPARCRRFVDEFIEGAWSGDPLSDVVRFDLELVTTELVTNAVNARSGVVTLEVVAEPHWIRVEVSDDGPGLPDLRDAALTDVGGRGLAIVAATALDWGYETHGQGKTVWARIAV